MRITRTQAWSAATVALCALLVAASWFLLIAPQRADAGDSRLATEAARATNAQLEVRIAELRREYADLPAREQELAALRRALPADTALSILLSDLDAAATTAGVSLVSVTAGQATTELDGPAPAPEPATAEAGTDSDDSATNEQDAEQGTGEPEGAGADGAAGSDPAGGDTTGTDAAPSGTAAASGTAGSATPAADGSVLAGIPVTTIVRGDFFAVADFVSKAQKSIDRAYLVDGLLIALDDDSSAASTSVGVVTATLTGFVFVYVDPNASDAPAETGPGTATDTPSATDPGGAGTGGDGTAGTGTPGAGATTTPTPDVTAEFPAPGEEGDVIESLGGLPGTGRPDTQTGTDA